MNRRLLVVMGGIAVLLLGVGPEAARFWLDYEWFREVGQQSVLLKILGTRWLLGLTFGGGLFLLAAISFRIAGRHQGAGLPRSDVPVWLLEASERVRGGLRWGSFAVAGVVGLAAGLAASEQWDAWMRCVGATQFGRRDPVFGLDASFFALQLPFLRFVSGWLVSSLLTVLLFTSVIYLLSGALGVAARATRVAPGARAHLSILAGLTCLAVALAWRLSQLGLVTHAQAGGLFHGAGYTDVHARLLAYYVLIGIAGVAALGFLVNTRVRALWLPVASLVLLMAGWVLIGGVYPSVVQRFTVVPNQQAIERPYIRHALEWTRWAYGLDDLQRVEYPLGAPLAASDLGRERLTLENIRLWDYRLLAQTYQTLQHLRDFYDVSDVDVDRYRIDGHLRQVMLAARELVPDRLDPRQQTWVNRKLQYTHGYGLLMSRVNDADPSGRPAWLIRDLPLVTAAGLSVSRPQLYFGARPSEPVFAPSATPEIDFPAETTTQTSAYTGSGGIPVGSGWRKLLMSAALGEGNVLISDQIRPSSKLLIRRQISERVAGVAPFLTLDRDPYLVLDEGRLVWMIDAYTTANGLPFSAPLDERDRSPSSRYESATGPPDLFNGETPANYVRNSVKAAVDAYTGSVTLYVIDEVDPVLSVYRRAFPRLFRPAAEIPESLRAHIRYPEDLFSVQTRKLMRYHVADADQFYQGSDEWDVPMERRREAGGAGEEIAGTPMEPYYVIMRLPGETDEEFCLILPFKTKNGSTLPAWLVARCDPQHYGRLRLYRFPATAQVDTPEQVDNAIRSEASISKEITLLASGGSGVRYGNFLVLPVGKSLLYVKPLFLVATQQGGQEAIPRLAAVIVAERRGDGVRVVMENTLRQALAVLVGGQGGAVSPSPPGEAPTGEPPPGSGTGLAASVRAAEAAFVAAEKAQREGDWAEYGRQMKQVREALRRARTMAR